MEQRKVILLPDAPAAEDAFGPHKRIAAGIQTLIQTEDGGRAIALVGTWGCGKSTVINILRNSAGENLAVFVFDAWAHEGDPLRRTFLESFIKFTKVKGWVQDEKKWTERLDELAQRVEKNELIVTPTLTEKGVFFSALLCLTGVGLAMLSAGPSIEANPSGTTCWYTWLLNHLWLLISIAFTVVPPLWLVCHWIKLRAAKAPDTKEEVFNFLGGLVNKQTEKTTTTTIKSPEPTSVEFQSWFYEISAEVLSGDRRLLLVIDNLDRIGSEEALRLWSSMRAFLDFSDVAKPEWAKKLWTLVAFDENAIEKHWGQTSNVGAAGAAHGQTLATAFKEKTFQISFHIPTPLLSEWANYLKTQLHTAFPDYDDDEFYKISRIYEIVVARIRPPTPRHIIHFINQTGALLRTGAEPMPLSQLTLYVAFTEAGEKGPDFTAAIRKYRGLEHYAGDGWRENLSAVYFGTTKEKAIQFELGVPIGKAITEGNRDAIQQLISKHGADFVLKAGEQIITEKLFDWKSSEPRMIARAAYTLLVPEIVGQTEERFLYQQIKGAVLEISAWPLLDEASGKGLSLIIIREKDPNYSRKILLAMSASTPFSTQTSENDISQFLRAFSMIFDCLIDNGQGDLIPENFHLLKTSSEYLAALGSAALDENGKKKWRLFRPGCDPQAVITSLTEEIIAGRLDTTRESAIDRMMKVDWTWNWPDIINGLAARLQSNQPSHQPSSEEAGRCMRILLRLRKYSPMADAQLSNFANVWLFYRYGNAQNDTVALASATLVAMLYDPEGNKGPISIHVPQMGVLQTQGPRNTFRSFSSNPKQNEALLSQIIGQASSFVDTEELLRKRSEASNSRPLFDAVLLDLAQRENASVYFSSELIFNQYPKIKTVLDEPSMQHVVKLSLENSDLENRLLNLQPNASVLSLFRVAIGLSKSTALSTKIAENLRSLTKDDWLSAMQNQNDIIPLVEELQARKVLPGVGYVLRDALNDFSDGIRTGAIPAHMNEKACDTLIYALVPEQQISFKRDIRDKVIGLDSSAGNILSLFSKALSDWGILLEKADDIVRVCFEKMLGRKNPTEFKWIKLILEHSPEILTKCHKETRDDFLERLTKFDVASLNQDCRGILIEIKRLCGMPGGEGSKVS